MKIKEFIVEDTHGNEETIELQGGHIRIISPAPYSPRDASVVEFWVDEAQRNQGIGAKLIQLAASKYPDLGAQVSSVSSLKAFYNNNFRNPKIPDGTFEDHVAAFKENWGSLFVASTDRDGNKY